jgi:proteasome lid subunit RPN8/RPN11
MIKIPKMIYDAMIGQAVGELPDETCGYLAGTGDRIFERIPMTNVDHSPEHFTFDPAEQFAALKTARGKGMALQVVYHSHPSTPARLSEEDLRLLNDPSMIYIIVSLADAKPSMRAFRVVSKVVSELPIQITEGDIE